MLIETQPLDHEEKVAPILVHDVMNLGVRPQVDVAPEVVVDVGSPGLEVDGFPELVGFAPKFGRLHLPLLRSPVQHARD